jgi:preprotein translocase subunit Sec63
MNRKEWQAVEDARKFFGLGEKATQGEMKRAYYGLSKQYHPDTAGQDHSVDEDMMCRLTEAYNLLMRYCEEYRFPLSKPDGDIYDAEDWWMDRFGQDPPW